MLLLTRYIKNNRGQTLVEFALILPVLLLLLVGTMDVGLLINQHMILSEAAREGARSAALGGSNDIVRDVVRTAARQMDTSQLVVTITPSDTRVRGESVTVSITNPVNRNDLLKDLIPEGFAAQGSATMRVE